MKNPSSFKKRIAGFTLIESMISVLLITIVVGATFRQIQKSQASYRAEDQKLDMTQQERAFIDQFTRDLRQAGYPSPLSSGIPQPVALNLNQVSAGITAISANSVTMEGDLDNTGQVMIVTYSFLNAAAPCPCIQRTIQSKDGTIPASTFTSVQNVVNPGAAGIFSAYSANGGTVALPLTLAAGATNVDPTYAALHAIRSVRVTFGIQGTTRDVNGVPFEITMTGMARIPND